MGIKPQFRSTNIANQAVLLASATVAGQGLLAVAFVLAARWSTPTQLGMLVTAMAVGATINGIADFGATTLWVREVAAQRLGPTQLNALMVSKFIILLGLFSIVSLVAYIIAPSGTLYWVSGLLGFSVMINQMMQVPLRGNARGDLASIVVFVDRLGVFAIYYAFYLLTRDAILSLTLGLLIGPILAALVARLVTPRTARGSFTNLTFSNPWKGSKNFGFTNIVLSSQSMDAPILTLVGGPSATGIYGAVNKWTQPMSIVSSAFTSATAPYLARTISLRDVLHKIKGSLWIPSVGCVGAILIAVYSRPLVELLLGPDYSGAETVLCVLALASVPGIINTFFLTLFQYSGRDKSALWIILIAVTTQLITVGFLGSTHGALAAAYGFAVGQLVQLILFGSLLFGPRASEAAMVKVAPRAVVKKR